MLRGHSDANQVFADFDFAVWSELCLPSVLVKAAETQ